MGLEDLFDVVNVDVDWTTIDYTAMDQATVGIVSLFAVIYEAVDLVVLDFIVLNHRSYSCFMIYSVSSCQFIVVCFNIQHRDEAAVKQRRTCWV